MRFSVAGGDGFDQGTDALVRLMRKDEKDKRLEKSLGGALTSLRERKVFEGKEGQVSVLPVPEGSGAPEFVILAGIGDEASPESVRCAGALAARRARAEGLKSIAFSASTLAGDGLDSRGAAQAVVEGVGLGLYRMDKYKSANDDEKAEVSRVVLCGGAGRNLSAMRRGVRYGRALCEGTNYARDLINTPSNEKRPPALAEMARAMARREGLRCRVLDEKQMARQKMGALLSVSRGSSEPARMVILEYRPQGARTKPIAFVGKGVTFDTGGISIKPSGGLELMTTDMSGAAAVLGAMLAVARSKPRVPVVGVAGLVENMVDGDATRPGDIVRSMKGTTVEIHNTDAEGRLVLADALHYTREQYKPQCMIDLATLTGACMVALGQKVTGMYGTHDELLERVRDLGERTGDRVWHMPLFPEYGEAMKGKIADMCNISGARWGGANTAAAFLQHFADETPWVHLDIAGPSHTGKAEPYRPEGGTGVGVRILAELAMAWKRLTPQEGKAYGC